MTFLDEMIRYNATREKFKRLGEDFRYAKAQFEKSQDDYYYDRARELNDEMEQVRKTLEKMENGRVVYE